VSDPEHQRVVAVIWGLHGGLLDPGTELPLRGIEDVLRDVPARTHRFALVTVGERAAAERLLARHGWSWRFEVVVEERAALASGVSPYGRACEALGVSTAQALVVEGLPTRVASARDAGFQVAAPVGPHTAGDLTRASFVLSNVGAVVGLLRALGG